ncbi:hypothetical protein QQS21_000867 [Conoideocrella luteorostrata]|uniref:Major facilitator superfamily (MFS) profile domain-containing protein n=1 Tax=Conoideocrella luteorostrata TaxID=1105319 RepID=A0AAJ0CY90_9HYPO|nr:hypothetical protein QQS21_000867 [Conoideocrella luteorostrata]
MKDEMTSIQETPAWAGVQPTKSASYNDNAIDLKDEQVAPPPVSKATSIMMVLVGGVALFSDGYNAQVVGYMNPILAKLYPNDYNTAMKTRMSNAFLIGEVFGMLFFGWAIDRLGRRNGIFWATVFLVLGLILATAAHGTSVNGQFWMMIIGRGVAGFGAGGEYPTCATSATEAADENADVRKRRGILAAAATDFAIDMGFIIAGVVALIVLAAYGWGISDGVWRVCFGLGIVLPVAVLFFRLRLINSTQYKKHAMKQHIPYLLVIKRYWKPMLGTSLSWFMYDFVTYPFGIFGSTVIETLNPNDTLMENIGYGTVLNLFYIPGTLIGGLLMDRIGRKQTMTLGFVLWSIMGFIIGGGLHKILTVFPLFVVLYGTFNALGEMGPGVATFLCGAESFPTPVRGHFLGFAAAVGKAGAAIGTQVFIPIQNSFDDPNRGVQGVFLIGAAFAMTGALISWFLIPDKERDLENEDALFREYLAQHGYAGVFGEVDKENATTATLTRSA